MARAASTPVGSGTQTRTQKLVDSIAIVLAPLLVPAGLLAVVRSEDGRSFLSGFTIADIAFGVVAVAFAALARALTGKGEGWTIVAAVGILAIVFETGIGVSRDSALQADDLTAAASACVNICNSNELRQVVEAFAATAASPVHWISSLTIGLILCSTVLFAIWLER